MQFMKVMRGIYWKVYMITELLHKILVNIHLIFYKNIVNKKIY
jgi:hypothetical protein